MPKSNKKMVKKDKKGMDECDVPCHGCCSSGCGSLGCVYGLGFIGAAVHYISIATGFWSGVLGVLKALVWPAFLVYQVLKYLN